jgi:hypothetical protein
LGSNPIAKRNLAAEWIGISRERSQPDIGGTTIRLDIRPSNIHNTVFHGIKWNSVTIAVIKVCDVELNRRCTLTGHYVSDNHKVPSNNASVVTKAGTACGEDARLTRQSTLHALRTGRAFFEYLCRAIQIGQYRFMGIDPHIVPSNRIRPVGINSNSDCVAELCAGDSRLD